MRSPAGGRARADGIVERRGRVAAAETALMMMACRPASKADYHYESVRQSGYWWDEMPSREGRSGFRVDRPHPVPAAPGRSPGAVARLPITPIDGRNWTAAMLTDFISDCTASTSTWRRNVTRLSELRCVTLVTQFVSRCNHSSIHWQSFTVNSSHHSPGRNFGMWRLTS